MPFTTKLFRIVISNSYYRSNTVQNDFYLEPLRSTDSWMAKRRISLLHHADGIELIWLSQGYDDPFELFKKKADGITLSFVMILKNSQALNFAQLEAGYPNGQFYYLHNRHKNSNNLLHGKAFMSESDLMKTQDLPHYPMQPGSHVFAIIDVDLTHYIQTLSKQKNNLFSQAVTYGIKIQNRSTFWRYYLIDTQKRLSGPLAIISQGDTSYFGQIKLSSKSPATYCAESTLPIELCDQYDRSFSLCKLNKSGIKDETILLKKLPYPTYDSLKKGGVGKKKLYSDIVVYV